MHTRLMRGEMLKLLRTWPKRNNQGKHVHGIGEDGMEAKSSRQSRENNKVAVEYLWINENVADIIFVVHTVSHCLCTGPLDSALPQQ